ncbi:LOW QUALITY PROTEIN: CD109 antigen-like [Lethenteron reissneri]|uniref:LOW QUALITY PROTEIN: CD109 antigen-like n=1 Tax=Lethenteron reissneri TaxID=7753 RepID=UPI002AB64867|nr:LOW QUALITY PROTEIN: CD109 antigen-like [Lethenteron reissneri]
MKVALVVVVLLALLGPSHASNATFFITAPSTIRPGQGLALSISLLNGGGGKGDVTVVANVTADGKEVLRKQAVLPRGTTTALVLPALPLTASPGSYELQVHGVDSSGLLFVNSSTLIFDSRALLLFVQTDKAVYKPGQTVHFRAFSVDSSLRPHLGGAYDIEIQDPVGNRVQQWRGLTSASGVVSADFPVSDQPLLGQWQIIVHGEGVDKQQPFTVAEYVLPKFEVLLKLPSFVAREDGQGVSGTVEAKYTYGKMVRGNATVTLIVGNSSPWGWQPSLNLTIRNLKLDGNTSFAFSSDEVKALIAESFVPDTYTIEAHVTELLTGITQSGGGTVKAPEFRVDVKFVNSPVSFKAGLNYTAYVHLSLPDDSPLLPRDLESPLLVQVSQTNQSSALLSSWKQNYNVTASGVVAVHFSVLPDAGSVHVNVVYKQQGNDLYLTKESSTRSGESIQLSSANSKAQAGEPLQFSVTSTEHVEEFFYQVVSRGNVVATGKVNSNTFQLVPTSAWAPSAHVVVHYVRDDGEVVPASVTFNVAGIFENKVVLNWTAETSTPASSVSLKVSTSDAQAFVGVLVVDKSVLLLKTGNDITADSVTSAVSAMASSSRGGPLDAAPWGRFMPLFWLPNPSDSLSTFTEAGLVVLTDAYVHHPEFFYYYKEEFHPLGGDIMNMVPVAAPAGAAAGAGAAAAERVRTLFPETWIWADGETGNNRSKTFTATVPDSITSWVASAFSVSSSLGLGVADTAQLRAFQPFFVSLNLPYSVVRGEQFVVQALVFNYLDTDLQVRVTLDPSDAYVVLVDTNEVGAIPNEQLVTVRSQDAATVSFPVSPALLGLVPITVRARAATAADAVTQQLLVKAEGVERSFSKTLLLQRSGGDAVTQGSLAFTFPNGVVEGSQRATLTVIGDIMGPSISGLERLVQMPYGCGEQNMINFAPNIYVIKYLTATGQGGGEIKQRALSFMNTGYQRELTYQRSDGSFSAFGNEDASGSTWLSAFVLRCFLQALPHVFIDPGVVAHTHAWLMSQLDGSTGVFAEPGRVIHVDMQGGSSGPLSLTAYALVALLEQPSHMASQPQSDVSASVRFLETSLRAGIAANHTLALTAYALSLANSTAAPAALQALNSRAATTGEVKFWTAPVSSEFEEMWQPRSADIEMTSYALLAYLHQGNVTEGIPIMKWLSQQRNHLGGYSSTQDTVVGLQALSEFAARTTGSRSDLQVRATSKLLTGPLSFTVNSANALVLQRAEIPVSPEINVALSATGAGFAVAQLNVFYNLKMSGGRAKRSVDQTDAFELTIDPHILDLNNVDVTVCVRWTGAGSSGMALLQVNMLSGFVADSDFPKPQAVKRVEVDGGKVTLYLDSLNGTSVCVTIRSTRVQTVGSTQEAQVSITDYYEPRRRTERSYSSGYLASVSVCELCGANCKRCNEKLAGGGGARTATLSAASLLAVLFSVFLLD